MKPELILSKPAKPYIMGSGTPNKYNKTSMDGHRVLPSGAIVAKTTHIGVRNKETGKVSMVECPEGYDDANIKRYKDSLESWKSLAHATSSQQ